MPNKRKKGRFKKHYTPNQRKAYWIGVGISLERHAERERFLNHPNNAIRKSAIAGYDADNHFNVSERIR